jgi:predicted TIM-barrel fold metal-dependent hydrolase
VGDLPRPCPLDAPESAEAVPKLCEQLHSDDILLYSSDYPHWQFDGDDVLPAGVPDALRAKIMVDNPLATYPRCRE